MRKPTITQNGTTNQFEVVVTEGNNKLRCIVSVATQKLEDDRTVEQKKSAAFSKAQNLAKSLVDAKFEDI